MLRDPVPEIASDRGRPARTERAARTFRRLSRGIFWECSQSFWPRGRYNSEELLHRLSNSVYAVKLFLSSRRINNGEAVN
jgi:hypothetical protein